MIILDGIARHPYHENDFQNHNGAAELENLLQRIDDEILAAGGKRSKSRSRIIREFFLSGRHVTIEELTRTVRGGAPGTGAATVYRTLKLLEKMGFAKELDFGDGAKRYESNLAAHHDHLVCRTCGVVMEFEDEGIEAMQEQVARKHGFHPVAHRLEIYGYCRSCRPETRRRERKVAR